VTTLLQYEKAVQYLHPTHTPHTHTHRVTHSRTHIADSPYRRGARKSSDSAQSTAVALAHALISSSTVRECRSASTHSSLPPYNRGSDHPFRVPRLVAVSPTHHHHRPNRQRPPFQPADISTALPSIHLQGPASPFPGNAESNNSVLFPVIRLSANSPLTRYFPVQRHEIELCRNSRTGPGKEDKI
jgi:hypothetical protein